MSHIVGLCFIELNVNVQLGILSKSRNFEGKKQSF